MTLTGIYPGFSFSGGGGLTAPVQINQGGTGAITVQGAQVNLGIIGQTFNVQNPIYAGGVSGWGNWASGSITAGSTTLQVSTDCPGCNWPVGTGISISSGTGYSGQRLTTTVVNYNSISNTITLAAAPSFSVTATSGFNNIWTDDTAAINAAFAACNNGGNLPIGGVVEFPGPGYYNVSSTINMLQGCRIKGEIGAWFGNDPVEIRPIMPTAGVSATVTNFTISSNCTTGGASCKGTSAFPIINNNTGGQYEVAPHVVTFTGNNTFAPNQWIDILGCSNSQGNHLNRLVLQVASATSTGFVAVTNGLSLTNGTYTDTCTATTRNVVFATAADARYEESIERITIGNPLTPFDIGFYYGSRVDTGSYVKHTWVSSAQEYSYYFSNGGINTFFNDDWRSDGAVQGGIYWRVGGGDTFSVENGTVDNYNGSYLPTSYSGPAIVIDNQDSCGQMWFSIKDVKVEVNSSLWPGEGVVTVFDCPTSTYVPSIIITAEQEYFAPHTQTTAGFNFPGFAMIPANDETITLVITNSAIPFGLGSNTTQPFTGITGAMSNWIAGAAGAVPFFYYAPAFNSMSDLQTSNAPFQINGDLNIQQLRQYGVKASDFLYVDTGFSTSLLENGTTVYAGQIIAPPSYWNGVNGKRYALDVVYQSGTNGTLNGGATTCATPIFNVTSVTVSGTTATITGTTINAPNVISLGLYGFAGTGESWLNGQYFTVLAAGLTGTTFQVTVPSGHSGYSNLADTGTATDYYNIECSTGAGVGVGTFVAIGSNTSKMVTNVDATNPSYTVLFLFGGTIVVPTASTLSYAAPVLGPEMQLSTKSAGAPTSLAWSQGDFEQNSGATANGVAGWMNVSAGTPGTWAGVPLGDSSGKITVSQISNLATISNVQVGSVTSASGTVTTAHSFATAFTATPCCVAAPLSNSGAWYFSTLPSTTSSGVITYVTSGAQTFSESCIGAGGIW